MMTVTLSRFITEIIMAGKSECCLAAPKVPRLKAWVENHPRGGAVFSFAPPVTHPDGGRAAGEGL